MDKHQHSFYDNLNIFERIVDSIDNAIISNDLLGQVLSWNKAAEKIFGYTFEEIKIKSILLIFPTELIGEETRFIDYVKENKVVENYKTKRIRKDGKVIDISITVWPLKDEKGTIIGLSKIIQDITKRSLGELKVVESEEKYKNLFENGLLPMWLIDIPSLKFLDINIKSIEFYGYSKEEFLNMTVFDIIPERERLRAKNIDRSIIGYQIPTKYWLHLKKNGDLVNVEVTSIETIFDGRRARLVISNDITERIKSEERFNKSNKEFINVQLRYQSIIDHSLITIILATPDGVLIETNKAATKLFGYTNEEFKGIHRNQIIEMSSPEAKLKLSERDRKGNIIGEFVGIKKNGDKFFCEITSVIFKDYSGKPFSSNMITDISDRKNSELRDRKSRELLKQAEVLANIGSMQFNLKSQETVWSDGFYTLLGYEPQTLIPSEELFYSHLTIEEAEKQKRCLAESIKLKYEKRNFDLHYTRKDNQKRILDSATNFYYNDAGELESFISVMQDVTAAREDKLALEVSLERIKMLTEKIPIALLQLEFLSDNKFQITFVSKGIYNIYKGLNSEDLQNNPISLIDWVIEEDKGIVRDEFQKCLLNQADIHLECRIVNPYGELSWIKIFYRPEKFQTGNTIWYGYIEEITSQKELLLNLEKQNKQLKEITWTQSHIFRAPLSRLMGLVDALKRGKLSIEEQQQFLNYIDTSAQELDTIIRNITNLSSKKQ
jgi:PAS domain S-box-containing protein